MIRLLQAYRVWATLRLAERRREVHSSGRSQLPLVKLATDARFMHDVAVCAMQNGSGTYSEFLARLPAGLCPCQGEVEDPGPVHIPRCPWGERLDSEMPF